MLDKLMFYTFWAVVVFYIARNPQAFSGVIGALSSAYTGSVRALQGR